MMEQVKSDGDSAPPLRLVERSPAQFQCESCIAIQTLPFPIWVFDATTLKVLAANGPAPGHYGYSREEFLSLGMPDLIAPEDLPRFKEFFRQRSTVNGPPFPVRHRKKDGTIFDVELFLHDTVWKGQPARHALAQDVSEQQRTRKALRESEDRFRLMVDGVTDYAIFLLDPKGLVASWNKGAQRMKGYREEEIVGKPFSVFFSSEDVQKGVVKEALQVAAERGRWQREGWRVRKDGSRFWGRVFLTSLRDESGRLQGFSSISRDITERRRAERFREALFRISEKLHAIQDPDLLLNSLVVEAIRLVGAEAGYAGVQTPKGMASHAYLQKGDISPLRYSCQPGEGIPGWMLLNKVPYVTNDARRDERMDPSLRDQFGIRSALAVPLLDDEGEIIAFFEVDNKTEGDGFTQEDQEQLLAVSKIAAVAMSKALGYRKLKRAELRVRHLSDLLVRAQEEERRRVGRELHDIPGQSLGILLSKLSGLSESSANADAETLQALSECMSFAKQCQGELRALSYLLHPPVLDDFGVAVAVGEFVEGFARRSGIQVALDVPPDFPRLPAEVEAALYWVIRESLTNILRHAQTHTAEIQMRFSPAEVTVRVSDHGKRISAPAQAALSGNARKSGVGIDGMRARVQQLGGVLDFHSTSEGSSLSAIIPLPQNGEDFDSLLQEDSVWNSLT